ncbi:MAG: DUF2062 domain-containing protein [Saprospiraceae bacterium]|nr:DUF2062 domain-containing protein [Saprospiraceae bacterium]
MRSIIVKYCQKLLAVFKQGLTWPEMVLAVLAGLLLTIFPVVGVTNLLMVAFGLRFKVNIPIMIVVSYIAAPLQFLAMMPFIHLGERIVGVKHTLLTVDAIKAAFQDSFFQAIRDLGLEVVCGVSGWMLIAIPIIAFLLFTLKSKR